MGKYCVEHVLGEGGMGIVLAARHLDLGELFAIKLMLPAALADREAVERSLREARAAARLKSEHVAHVHDVGRLENGAPYMVMEHLSGQDLQKVVRARGPLPPQEAVLHVYQACEAVAEAHALGVVHRDLKSANLFLTQRVNGSSCVKVLDFGISKELDPAQKLGPDLTKTGTFMGSPKYMSPEQMAHIKETDARSDIWSLGVILFELLTGRCPFVGESLMELISRVATLPPPRPTELRPDLPPGLEEIVLKCLEKPRERRYQSVPELMTALRPFVVADERLSMSSSPSLPSLSSRSSLPAPVPMAPTSTPAITTLTATPTEAGAQKGMDGLTDLGGNQTTKAWSRPSVSSKGRGSTGLVVGAGAAIAIASLAAGGAWLASGRDAQGTGATAGMESGAALGMNAASTSMVTPLTSAAAPEVAPAGAVASPRSVGQGTALVRPTGEPAAPMIAPSTSASTLSRSEAGAVKKTSPRPTSAPKKTTTAAPEQPAGLRDPWDR